MAAWLEPDQDQDQEVGHRPKVRAVGSSDRDALMREYQHSILSAQTAKSAREALGAMHNYLTPLAVVSESIKVHKDHNARTQGQSGHKLGPAYLHGYRVFIRKLIAEAKAKKPTPESEFKDSYNGMIELLEGHLEEYSNAGTVRGAKFINVFKVRDTREGLGVLTFQLSTLIEPTRRFQLETAIVGLVEHLGGELKPGPAPRSDAERKHQNNIDTLKQLLNIGKS